jgi:hypothetical protein
MQRQSGVRRQRKCASVLTLCDRDLLFSFPGHMLAGSSTCIAGETKTLLAKVREVIWKLCAHLRETNQSNQESHTTDLNPYEDVAYCLSCILKFSGRATCWTSTIQSDTASQSSGMSCCCHCKECQSNDDCEQCKNEVDSNVGAIESSPFSLD